MLICVLFLDMSDIGDFYGRYICGDQGIVKVDHHVLRGEDGLQGGDIHVGDRTAGIQGKRGGHTGGLPFYDLFAPVGKASKAYTIEEAREVLLREMGKFTPDMAAFMDNAFAQRWIDVYPREGKSGGEIKAIVDEKKEKLSV